MFWGKSTTLEGLEVDTDILALIADVDPAALEQARREHWCLQGELAGFSRAEACRLAFWRWQAQQRARA